MALNNDFKVKNSLYVGNSAYFVTQTDTPTILSAGNSLFDIFLQEGEGGSGILSGGDGITDFMFDSLSAATVAVDGTVVRTTGDQSIAGVKSFSDDLVVDTNTLFVDASTNTVGLGTSTPTAAYSLDVVGGIKVSQFIDVENDYGLRIKDTSGNPACVVRLNSSNQLAIGHTSSTVPTRVIGDYITLEATNFLGVPAEAVRVIDGGNVGIGTTTPGAKLTVNGGTCTTGLSATAANSGILSAGKDLNEIFQIIGSDSRGKVLSEGIGIQDFTYEGLSAQTVAVSQGILSAGSCESQGVFILSGAGGSGFGTKIDLGLGSGSSPTFTALTTGNLTATGTTIAIPNVQPGTDNTVVIRSGGNLATDEIDPKVWDIKLVDYGTLGQCRIPVATTGTGTLGNSIMIQQAAGSGFDVAGINVTGGLSALSLSGDGAGLNNVTATAIFPSTIKTTLGGGDKFFINDGANKHTTYTALLTSFGGGVGLTTSGNCLAVNGAAALDTNNLPRWNGSGFVNSIVKQTAAGNVNIAGGTTISGNLSVTGDFTCIETTISTTSALSVTNTGTGPALFVCQTGSQPIAHFIDQDGGDIVFADNGKLGIGTFAPSEKLTLVGNLSGIGNSTITGTSNVFGLATLGGGITATLASGTSNDVVVSNSGSLVTDGIDCKVWVCKLVDYNALDSNYIPKAIDDAGTIGNSCITDTGSLVTINSDTKIDEGHNFQVFATVVNGATAFCSFTKKATFSTVVTSASSHSLPTFAKANLKQAKYNVTLIKGVNVTAFEVQAVYNNTTTCGTVYGIVDGQAATQLDTASICNSGSTIDLLLKSASSGTCAIVSGEALYLG